MLFGLSNLYRVSIYLRTADILRDVLVERVRFVLKWHSQIRFIKVTPCDVLQARLTCNF